MQHFNFRIRLVFFLQCVILPVAFCQHSNAVDGSVTGDIPYVQEKLYVHTDKESYLSREIIWFRIYYVNAVNNEPEYISKIAYVEILDRNNLPVLQQKVSLKPGESFGSIEIPAQVSSGMYKFRAYTNWMKNFDAAGYFEKPIRIVNPFTGLTDSSVSKIKRYDIQFFPEGGNLVQNLESKIGFRVADAFGHGQDFEGFLLNEKNDTLLKFRPARFGIGNFNFKPEGGHSYKAVIRFPGGKEVEKNLPAVFEAGYVMKLSKSADGISVHVSASPGLDLSEAYLIVQGSHALLPGEKKYVTDHREGWVFKPGDLHPGISLFTFYNKKDHPVCERLYFNFPEDKLLITADIESFFTTRKKIDLHLHAADQQGKPLSANMSLAVYRLDSLQQTNETDIRNCLYLTSDIGPVESPGYYFQAGESREEAMDNLMLTHGWRKFDWKNSGIKNNTPEFVPEFNGHIIYGKVLNSQSGKAVPWSKVYISVPSARTQFRPTISDESGKFKVEMVGFYGSQELIVQNQPGTVGTSTLEIASPFSQKYSPFPLPEYHVSPGFISTITDLSVQEQAQHIYSRTQMNKFVLQEVDTNTFYVVPDEKYMLDDYTRFLTMEEVLREYVHSSNVTGKEGSFNVRLVDNGERHFFDQTPLILIDGVPFFDPNELFKQDPKKIKRLDLVNKEYTLGDLTFPGILNVTTYSGDLGGIQMNAHAIVLDYPGIPEQREFYSPVYESEKQIMSRKPDFRTLLFWTPEIKSDAAGKNQISFYASDIPGKYALVVQGITALGEPGVLYSTFEVKK